MSHIQISDYAKVKNANKWLRHPTFGDPSFDTFKKINCPIHISSSPYEWAVNASLFEDPKSKHWYCYAALYPYGYKIDREAPYKFIIYKSVNKGVSWELLGDAFEKGFMFDGYSVEADFCPDACMFYDAKTDLYWLSYDWNTNDFSWEFAHKIDKSGSDSGAALAYASSPEGPFTRLERPIFSNREFYGKFGRFSRGYATTVLRRQNDWIAYVLCDSNDNFSWGLACMTAKTPFGPWSEPTILLSVDRTKYFPAPLEFYPLFLYKNKVYAPATSVSLNRNYQGVFVSDLEKSHCPKAWKMAFDGNFWHGRNLPDEKYGIWGQTVSGFVERKTGDFVVAYPSRNQDDLGTIGIAKRKWEKPFQDKFVFSGHAGKSISILFDSYKEFLLEAEVALTGEIEIIFNYEGILGLDRLSSDATLHKQALSSYYAVSINDKNECKIIYKDDEACEHIISSLKADSAINHLKIENKTKEIIVLINKKDLLKSEVAIEKPNPVGILAHEFSILKCNKFKIKGEKFSSNYKLNSFDALMGGGQKLSNWNRYTESKTYSNEAFYSDLDVFAKWNFIGKGANLFCPKCSKFGIAEIRVDGKYYGEINLKSDNPLDSEKLFSIKDLEYGQHCLALYPKKGNIVIDMLEIIG